MTGEHFDFFISHAGTDRVWAEWVAWQLTEAGYTVELDVWNWAAGQNFVTAISNALERCDRVVALFSSAYFDRSRYTTQEWTAASLHVLGTAEGKLVPVRVDPVVPAQMPAVLRTLLYRDLFGITEEQARKVLLEAVAGPCRPDDKPEFPGRGRPGSLSRLGGASPRLPGRMPQIWNVPASNPGFVGRDELLEALRERLLAGDKAGVQALYGMGGVGKTQLTVEYAFRFASTYDLVWWVNSEQGLIGDQFAALGLALGCIDDGADMEVVRRVVPAKLRERGRWLLVFDNAENPADIVGWLPGGGHVLITSRERGWAEIATPVEVDVLARTESVAILRNLVPALTPNDADRVADALGDLPLALAQAAGYMANTGMPAESYVDLLAHQAKKILGQGRLALYPRPLAAVIQVEFVRLQDEDPAAAELAEMCAFLSPELIPGDWFTRAVTELPAALAAKAADPVAWWDIRARLGRNSLARIYQDGIQMHRLTQAILRSHLQAELAAVIRSCVEAVLVANNPGDPDSPDSWPSWVRLMPHLIAFDPAASNNNKSLRELACNAISYLLGRGDVRTGHDLAGRLYQHWHDRPGPDDEHTLWMAGLLASAAREMSLYDEARDLDDDTFTRRRRMLGDDNPSTLNSATNLAIDLNALGKTQAAKELHEATLARKRRVLGEDHPSTLSSANNLGITLRELGETQAARDLFQGTLARRRHRLGEDHPRTLDSAHNLSLCLYDLGDYQAAQNLDQDTLDRRLSVLGEDHPRTLSSAHRLAVDLHGLGELEAARQLGLDTLDHRRRVLGKDHPDTLASANNLAIDLRELGKIQAARDLHQDTLDQYRRVLGENHPSTLASADNLAVDLRELGEIQAARDLHQDTLDQYRRVLGGNHPSTLACADNLAGDLLMMGKLEAARDLHQDTLDQYRRVLGGNHPDTLRVANNLANDLRELGETQAAQRLDEATLDRYRRVLGQDHPSTLGSANNLAGDLHLMGELEAARDLYEDTLDRYRRVLGQDHPSTLACANNLAEDLQMMGELEAARDLYEDTLDRYRRVLGENHPYSLDAASSLAEVLRVLGETQ